MNTPNQIPIERLRQTVRYEPDTGRFFRIKRDGSEVEKTLRAKGEYLHLSIDYVQLRANRVAWALVHGVWPSGLVDHKNGDKNDNRIDNLRDVNNSINAQNRVSGNVRRVVDLPLGVYPQGKRYKAKICIDGVYTNLGVFTTPDEAAAAYLKFRRENCPGNTL